jgi:medium-chain acyl-[acyl-carrier-protein] hydrolase
MTSSLIFIPKIKPSSLIRLVCFPYAGGSSSTYLAWQKYLHADVELAVIELPGRSSRISEAPYQTMQEIVLAIFLELRKLKKKKCIFYGHSMGARVAYEVMLMFKRYNDTIPIHFIASGSIAPCVEGTREQIHNLPDAEFLSKVGALNGSHPDVLANQELMSLVLPAMRADFRIIETYLNKTKQIIPTRISVLAGDKDELEINSVEAWFSLFEDCTNKIYWIPGGHFFIDDNREEVLGVVNNLIQEHCFLD